MHQIIEEKIMKKRIGKINSETVLFNHTDKSSKELLEMFLTEKEAYNLSEESIKMYRYHCEKFIALLGEEADEPGYRILTQKKYNEFILDIKGKGIKDVTVAITARSIRAWLYWLMENDCIRSFQVKIPKFQKTIPDTYTDEELILLLEKPKRNCTEVEYETWVFINLAIATGMRLSSMLNMKVADIHFSDNTIVVNRTKNRNTLSLVVNDELLLILKKYIQLFELNDDDYLFCTGEKGKLAKRTMEDFVKRYNMKRGVQKPKLIHAFRHTFARNHYLQNHDMYRLKDLMGHTLISTTEHYLGSLGLDTSRKIEYNPQAQFSKKPENNHNRRQKISSKNKRK